MNATSDMFKFIKNFIEKGASKLIYRERAKLLNKNEIFVSENRFNVVTINALSNICNLCELLLNDYPSCSVLKECKNCKKTTSRNLILFNLDFEIIQSHGYNAIVQAIENYTITNHKQCTQCGGNLKLTIKYYSHLLIECVGDLNDQVPLKVFLKLIALNNVLFSLVGIINYKGGHTMRSAGHYTAYTLYGTKWILFDNLLKKCAFVVEDSITNPVVCLYIKTQ